MFEALRRFADFKGRSSRREFWLFFVFVYLVALVAGSLDLYFETVAFGGDMGVFSWLVILAFIVPGIAVAVRRFHDLDRTGWWMLLWLIPFFGWIALIMFWVTNGTRGPNRFGEDPKGLTAFQPLL